MYLVYIYEIYLYYNAHEYVDLIRARVKWASTHSFKFIIRLEDMLRIFQPLKLVITQAQIHQAIIIWIPLTLQVQY